MKLQEFCSTGQKRHAFLLTYGIQPAFFEAVALQALIDGGADRVVVLADETEVSNAIDAWPPPREVGRRWVLGKSAVTGLFHPKLIARIGRDDALVAILSGNLTSGGWGRNLEVGSAWSVGPMHEDKGGWLASILKTAQEWTRSPAARQLLREMAEATWLSENELQSGASRDVIFTTGTSRLFDRLSNRWQGRRFDHARIMTGSTDENGALLLELHKEFGIKSAEVFVTKERCSFIDKKIRALPLKVKLRAADSPQVLHAKMIHLSGKAGHVCAWGSANCSAAAWLVPPANGANIEIAVLDDAPDISVLDDLFDKFSGSKEFSGVDRAPDKKPEAPAPAPIRVHGAIYNSRRRTFLFELDVPEGIRNLAAIVQANNIKTRMSLEDEGSGSYFAELNSTETPDQMLSGLIEGRIGENIFCSDPFWIDQSFELAKRVSEKDVYRQFKKVNSSVSNGPERLQILSDLLSIAEEVMNDSSGIHLGARPKRDSDKERPALPLDPSKLVSMIRLVPRNWNNTGSTLTGTSNPSLSIFERLFFDPPEPEEATIPISEPDTEDYEGRPDATRPPPQPPPPPPRDEPSQAAVDLESRVKIQGQLTGYLNRLRSPDFARGFHPQRLSDAIFVIIATAYRAWRGGWLPGEASGSIAAKLANTLLVETISGHHGLLQAYKSQLSPELLVDYKVTLGHGRIWAALLAVLAIEPTSSASNSVLRGSALSQVYKASELIAAADPTSLSVLFDRSIASDLIAEALGVAPNVDKAVTALTEYISAKNQELLDKQEKYVERAQLFWSRWDGWHYPRQTGWGSVGTAVSLKSAMENDELVRQFVHAVTEAWLVPANPNILADSDISNRTRR